jgi:hypothetical protein
MKKKSIKWSTYKRTLLIYYFNNSLLLYKMRFSSQDQIPRLDLQINSNKIYASAWVQQTLVKILSIQELFKLFILPFYY